MPRGESGHRPPPPPRRKNRLFRFVILLVVIAAAVVGAFLYGVSRNAESEPVITSSLLEERLRSVQQLVTVEYHYTNMGKFEDQKDFYGWKVPFTSKSFIVSYDGIIKAGIDMSALRIEVNEDAKRITITMPESEIISHEILEDSLEVFDESSNIFNPITIQDYSGFTADQREAMESKAISRGLFTAADEKAADTVQSLLSMLPGMDTYALVLK